VLVVLYTVICRKISKSNVISKSVLRDYVVTWLRGYVATGVKCKSGGRNEKISVSIVFFLFGVYNEHSVRGNKGRSR